MTLTTHFDEALERIDNETDHVTGELAAYQKFESGVRALDPVSAVNRTGTANTGSGTTLAATTIQQTKAGNDRTEQVRELFSETVQPFSTADIEGSEPLVATIGEEFGEEIAMALAPTTAGQFTAEIKNAVCAAAGSRQTELRTMERALETERNSVESAKGMLEACAGWLIDANETPLLNLGFEELRSYHDTLSEHRAECDRTVRERQKTLQQTTSHNAAVGLTHRSLVGHLYEEMEISHPVLATTLRLDELCKQSQKAVRDHLTRRV